MRVAIEFDASSCLRCPNQAAHRRHCRQERRVCAIDADGVFRLDAALAGAASAPESPRRSRRDGAESDEKATTVNFVY